MTEHEQESSTESRASQVYENLPEILTVDEVAELLRVNRNTVYDLYKRGEISGGRRVGRLIRFSRSAVLQWVAGNGPDSRSS